MKLSRINFFLPVSLFDNQSSVVLCQLPTGFSTAYVGDTGEN